VASDTIGNGGSMHVAAMSGSSTSANRGRWNAMVTITVHDQSGSVIANTTVNGNWGGGANGGDSCITNASGQCAVSKSNIKNNVASVTFTVSDLQHAVNSYDAANNVITVVPVSSP
jgi:hypothetical protein